MSIPFYGDRKNYIPRKIEDYGDGGAFPEIHIKQYPLEMGRKSQTETNTLQLRINDEGKVNYDVTVLENVRRGKKVYSSIYEAEKININEEDLVRPSEEETKKLLQKVRLNLEDKLNGRLNATQSRVHQDKKNCNQSIFVKYTPVNQVKQINSGLKSRIIKIHQMPVDPLEPPKFYHKKLPIKPPSPPIPIMHSPLRIITYEDQKNWKIPPCISNWKNNKGFAIPLHQRLATTGKGLTDTPINDRFASMAEALYLAERLAREQVESRAMERRRRTEQMRKEREKKLRRIAKETREDIYKIEDREIETPVPNRNKEKSLREKDFFNKHKSKLTREDIEAQNEREQLREEARKQRKRQMGLEKAKGIKTFKERDISEQIALGQRVNKTGGEAMFDQRLFNHDAGISSELGSDELYNIYDRPMNLSGDKHIYRPKKLDDFVNKYVKLDELMSGGLKFKSEQPQNNNENNLGPVQFRKIKVIDLENDQFISKKQTKTEHNYFKRKEIVIKENLKNKRKKITCQDLEESKKKWWSCSNPRNLHQFNSKKKR